MPGFIDIPGPYAPIAVLRASLKEPEQYPGDQDAKWAADLLRETIAWRERLESQTSEE